MVEVSTDKRKAIWHRDSKMVAGPFNYPEVGCDNLLLNSNHTIFLDVFDESNLLQFVRTHTHIKGKILDTVTMANCNQLKVYALEDPVSDHYPASNAIFVKNVQSTPKSSTQVPSESTYDEVCFTDFLGSASQINFSKIRLISQHMFWINLS